VVQKALLTPEAARHALVAHLTSGDSTASLEALRVLHVCTSFEPARKLLASHVKNHPAALHAVVAMASQVQSQTVPEWSPFGTPSHLRFACELGTTLQWRVRSGERRMNAHGRKAAWWASVWFIWAVAWFRN
jgi:hypothetical protein